MNKTGNLLFEYITTVFFDLLHFVLEITVGSVILWDILSATLCLQTYAFIYI